MKNISSFLPALPLSTKFDRRSPISEQYRVIRTRLMQDVQLGKTKTVVVTSALDKEGKSTVAINLAIAFADTGLKVLLVDADLRSASLTTELQLQKQVGLSEVILSPYRKEMLPIVNFSKQLDILPSGEKQEQAAELLGKKEMTQLIEEYREIYDLIIFDTPSICKVADAQILSVKTDGTILVVRQNVANAKEINRAKEMIQGVQGHLIGAIANFSY